MIKTYIDYLVTNHWKRKRDSMHSEIMDIESMANGRLKFVDPLFLDFIVQFSELYNPEETVWYLSESDYVSTGRTETDFSWNDFELESIEYADSKEEVNVIRDFWESHLPFMISVKDGYAFLAIVIEGDEKGSIVCGNEPEYEITTRIANSFKDYIELHMNFIRTSDEISVLSSFV